MKFSSAGAITPSASLLDGAVMLAQARARRRLCHQSAAEVVEPGGALSENDIRALFSVRTSPVSVVTESN